MKLLEIASNSGSLGRGKPVRPVNAAREMLHRGLLPHGTVIPIRSVSQSGDRQREEA
jgi:hypothetical protein